ncbi:MAG: hypothetical protein HRT61_18450, partial [Ekhidna sp.]|nr:hypothetical protein [Ekhidna sp.]
VASGNSKESIQLTAVSPMFIDFYLKQEEDAFEGIWLHDFNVKGIPEEDNYWKARKINGRRIAGSLNE